MEKEIRKTKKKTKIEERNHWGKENQNEKAQWYIEPKKKHLPRSILLRQQIYFLKKSLEIFKKERNSFVSKWKKNFIQQQNLELNQQK
jgi:hypothetical protein